jgi:drug/metabolite transporter (DMT)-like permease
MVAILGGLSAALAWALSTLCSSRSSRMIEPLAVVGWVMAVGLVVTAPVAIGVGVPAALHGMTLVWLALSGAGNVVGLGLAYHAMRAGQVALVAPLVSVEGAVAALIAIVAGEPLAPAVGAALVVIAAGVVLAAAPPSRASGTDPAPAGRLRAVMLATAAAISFGVSLYATGRAGARLPSAWVVLSARLVGTVALAVPLALRGRLPWPGRALPLVVAAGLCEVAGFYAFTFGARHGIAVAAVLSSQFAALTLLGAYVFFGERLGRTQLAGVGTLLAGVALLSALRA